MRDFAVMFYVGDCTVKGLIIKSDYKPVRSTRRIAQEMADATSVAVYFSIINVANTEDKFSSSVLPVSESGYYAS